MKNILMVALLLISFCSFSADDKKDQSQECQISPATDKVDTTVIACHNYIVTKDPNGTTICRITDGTPTVTCQKVGEVK